MRGFREDFEAWRAALSPEERAMVQEQAKGEFNKKFRKSDEFKKDLPEEKVESFTKILGKFFDNEADDYKKDADARTPDYEGLKKRAGQKEFDMSLKNRIVEVNRDADRRYYWATMKIREAERKGERFPQSSPMIEIFRVRNNDTASHQYSLDLIEWLKKEAEDPDCPDQMKADIAEVAAKGVPPVGEDFEIRVPQVLVNHLHHMRRELRKKVEEKLEGKSEEEKQAYYNKELLDEGAEMIQKYIDLYVDARDEVEELAQAQKAWFKSQKEMPGKTKADVLKEIWEAMPEITGKKMPPLDEEMLAELAEEPAVIESEFRHNWGTADILYKSEAIDAFGMKYLLGVFETKEEAAKAFADWNAEYEQARVEMKVEMEQWGKQEQARLEKDTSGKERIKKVLEEARR